MPPFNELENLEIRLLMEGVFQQYGFDFRAYAPASLKRRIWKSVREEGLRTVSGFQERVLHDPACMERFLHNITADESAMFRDPGFYRAFRKKAIPLLRTYPYIRIWHAGCATGEEVYSMAILLHEEGLADRSRIYATDIDEMLLKQGREGIFALPKMKEYTDNYIKAGGTRSFSDYYTAKYDNVIFRPDLQRNILWTQHNLATDGCFNEFTAIVCRNVMIYFAQALQDRAHQVFYESLVTLGFLCIGSKESLYVSPHQDCYEALDEPGKIYRKIM